MAYGEGATLQEAADDLVARVLALVMAFRSGGIGPFLSEGPRPDLAMLESPYELGEIAAGGWDRPAPLRYVGVPPASPLAGVRTLGEGMPDEIGTPRPTGR